MIIYNSAKLAEEGRAQFTGERIVNTFKGSKEENLHSRNCDDLIVNWPVKDFVRENEELESLRRVILNSGTPTQATLEAFFGRFYIDVTRRAAEAGDLTALIAREVVNFDFPELIYLRDLEMDRGEMLQISGENDAVPLIEQNTGNVDTLSLMIKAVGWKGSLKNKLFNRFYSIAKIIEAASNAYIDARNAAAPGVLIGASYVASQQQAAVSTSGLTYDEKMYETLLAAYKKLKGLKDIQTGRKIATPSISLLVNSADTWSIENVVRGQLNGNGASARVNNRPGLPIGQIIEYDQGINHGFTVGLKTLSYPGVTAGKCYMFVPGTLVSALKRPLTMETGRGSVLELSDEERAWYYVQGTNSKALLGSSYPGTSIGAGYGNVVEVTLPT